MSILLVFFFCFKLILRQSLLSIWAASVTKYYFRQSYTQFFVGMDKESGALRENGTDRIVRPVINHDRENNSIDLFCYKIYMFPYENISKQTGVFNRWILLLKINIHCTLSIFLYQKITVFTWVDRLISDSQ